MNPDAIQELQTRLTLLEQWRQHMDFSDNLSLWKNLQFHGTARIIGCIYGGAVAADGTGTYLPSGWTSARTGTGQYTITHNLGTAKYAVVAVTDHATNTRAASVSPSANSFIVSIGNAGNSAGENNAFRFIVFLL